MAIQIKITELTDIGSNIASNTVLPVVNLAGTAITQKTNVGNIGNAILANAGTTLRPALLANLAYSVVNAAQPNITSVGTLNVNTLNISGGENGQYLQTDGAGHLSWVTGTGSGNGVVGGANGQLQFNLNGNFAGDTELTWDSGNNQLNTVNFAASTATIYGNLNVINVNATGNLVPNAIYTDHYYYANGYAFGGGGGNGAPGGADTQIQFNDNGVFGGNTGFTFDKTSGLLSSLFLAGDGNGLSNIQGANISGAAGLATYAGTANAVAGANVSGAVAYAGTANSVAVANVVGIGNIATVSLSGNSNQVLYGNGVFDGVPNPFNQDLNTTDNVQFANVTATDTIRFSNSGNLVGAMGFAPTYVSIESYGSNTVNITANDIYTWSFGNTGQLTTPDGTIMGDVEGANTFGFYNPNGNTEFLLEAGANVWSFNGATGNFNLPLGSNINFNGGSITQVANEDLYIRVSDAENDGWSLYTVVNDGAGNNLARTQLSSDVFRITTDLTGASYDWSFQNGQFVLPGNIQGVYGGDTSFYAYDNGSGGSVELKTISYAGDTLLANVTVRHPNVTISTQNSAYTWTFDGTGNLTVPGNIRYTGASPAPSINGFSSASFADSLTADQIVISNNAIYTNSGTSNIILNAQYGSATDAFIQVPTFQDGGEELVIKNGYGSSLGVRVQTGSGNFVFSGTSLTFPDTTSQSTAWTGAVALANVSGAGNIASVNLDGNASNILYGNGVFAAPAGGYSDSNVVTLLSSFGSNTISTTGNITVGAVSASNKIGYASGSTVTQTTNRGQGVTINALAGTIVTTSDTIASGDADYFYVNNNQVDPTTDIVVVQITSYNPGTYVLVAQPVSTPNNGFLLSISNYTAFASPTETITIRFMVLKSPNS